MVKNSYVLLKPPSARHLFLVEFTGKPLSQKEKAVYWATGIGTPRHQTAMDPIPKGSFNVPFEGPTGISEPDAIPMRKKWRASCWQSAFKGKPPPKKGEARSGPSFGVENGLLKVKVQRPDLFELKLVRVRKRKS